jgi:hypothetical protein
MEPLNSSLKITTSFSIVQPYVSCVVNCVPFAIFHKAVYSETNFEFNSERTHVILLAPLEAEGNISIHATSIIGFSSIKAKTGEIDLVARIRLFLLNGLPDGKISKESRAPNLQTLPANDETRKDAAETIDLFKNALIERNPDQLLEALRTTSYHILKPIVWGPKVDILRALQFFDIPEIVDLTPD